MDRDLKALTLMSPEKQGNQCSRDVKRKGRLCTDRHTQQKRTLEVKVIINVEKLNERLGKEICTQTQNMFNWGR